MKSLRAEANDLKAIEQMVKIKKVKASLLIDRYIKELSETVGHKKTLDLNFLAMLARCYGDKVAETAEKKIEKSKK